MVGSLGKILGVTALVGVTATVAVLAGRASMGGTASPAVGGGAHYTGVAHVMTAAAITGVGGTGGVVTYTVNFYGSLSAGAGGPSTADQPITVTVTDPISGVTTTVYTGVTDANGNFGTSTSELAFTYTTAEPYGTVFAVKVAYAGGNVGPYQLQPSASSSSFSSSGVLQPTTIKITSG